MSKEDLQKERLAKNEENQKHQDEWASYADEERTEGKERQAPANLPAKKSKKGVK